jgi:hypothetical protein
MKYLSFWVHSLVTQISKHTLNSFSGTENWSNFFSSSTHFLLIRSGKRKSFPLQAWSGSWGSRRLRLLDLLDFRHYKGGKVVTLMYRPPSPPGVFLVLIFRGWVNPRAHGSVGIRKKSPVTPLAIDPETFQLAAQCLNHYATPDTVDKTSPLKLTRKISKWRFWV